MAKSLVLGLGIATAAALPSVSSTESTRRQLAATGGQCFFASCEGSCHWSWAGAWWGGCQCHCESNYEGTCCEQQQLCGPSFEACPQDMISMKTVATSDLLDSEGKFRSDVGPRVNKVGPDTLKGIFWLTGQGDSSAALTFAGSYDGGDMGGQGLSEGEYATSIRVAGDRTWAFADDPAFGGNFETVGILDLVYQFRISEGSLEAPRAFNIIPKARNLGIDLAGAVGEFLLDFSAFLLTDEQAAARGYPGSVVWDRRSFVAGDNEVTSSRYDLVQVVDGTGSPIQPAYDMWIAYQESAAAGDTPGSLYYRVAEQNDGSLE